MPSKYVPKTNRKVRSSADLLERAARKVFEERLSYRTAANNFGVDKMTLMRYVKKKQANPNCAVGYEALSLQMRIFSPKMEEELAKHILFMADMYYGLSPEKCKELAFEFAMRNKLSIPQSWKDNRKSGIQWWISFKQWHNLSIRKLESTSIGRATAFNQHTVSEYFKNLGTVLDKNKLTVDHIFNIDETGVTTVQNPNNVVKITGMKNVGSVTFSERGGLVTTVYAICAAEYALPPMLIFPRV